MVLQPLRSQFGDKRLAHVLFLVPKESRLGNLFRIVTAERQVHSLTMPLIGAPRAIRVSQSDRCSEKQTLQSCAAISDHVLNESPERFVLFDFSPVALRSRALDIDSKLVDHPLQGRHTFGVVRRVCADRQQPVEVFFLKNSWSVTGFLPE